MRAKLLSMVVGLCLLASPALATERAQADYMVHCQGCHLADGSGFPERGVPDMRSVLIPFAQIEEGRGYLIQVPGSSLSSLSDERLTVLINWILQELAQGSETAEPYSIDEVTHWRAIPLEDPGVARARLLEMISPGSND